MKIEEVYMTSKRQAYEDKWDAQMDEWSAEIAVLNARADKSKAESRIEYLETVEALQGKHADAKTKLLELRAATEDGWEGLKTDAEKVWNDVKSAFTSAASRFK